MARRSRARQSNRPIESYDHRDKERLNNPPVGLVTPATDQDAGRKTYSYDPHLDPQLQWAGKAEHTSFEVPTVSLHVHERIDPRTIIEATRKRNGNGGEQASLFELPEENPPVRNAIEFYKHRHNWTNRLVAGDSLLVMNSLLEKEGMAGKVQMVYIDPPYGIRYGSNFQPFVNRRDVRDGRDEDLTQEPETIRAYRDTWELGIHSYLSYLRDRLLLAREMLTESGSCFVQIGDENLHYIRELMDDVFGGIQSRADPKRYVVQTANEAVKRCILTTTDPGDLVFDPTCGSGTMAYVAEQWGRRWITCDTSRVAISLAKQRLMTALFDYYELAHPDEGVGSGFKYKTVPHITLGSIANNPDIKEGMSQKEIDAAIARHAPQETLYDQPLVDTSKRRVTGPFSVEAVPAPFVKPIDDVEDAEPPPADDTVARSGETLRQSDWRDELLRTGIRGKAGQFVRFARLEPLPGCRHLHVDGETLPNDDGADTVAEGAARRAQRVVVSFGPDHAPLEQRQVNLALQEAETLRPSPKVIVFAAFQFDPEAAKDIDETNWPGITLLKAQMNADLLTEDLKKKRASNESFWLIGQPDVLLHKIRRGQNTGKWQVASCGAGIRLLQHQDRRRGVGWRGQGCDVDAGHGLRRA